MGDGKKVMIAPIIKSGKYRFKRFFKKPLQNKRFLISIRVKNIGDTPLDKFRIKKINVHDNSKDYVYTFSKEIDIDMLNPEEIRDVVISSMVYPFSGQPWLEFEIENKEIKTYQSDPCTGDPDFCGNGVWRNIFQVIDEHTYHQKIMNWILVALTFFMAATPIVNFVKFITSLFL